MPKTISGSIRSFLAGLMLLALLPGGSQAGQNLTIAAGEATGTGYSLGVAISTLIKVKLLPTLNINMTALDSSDADDVLERLLADDAQLAILPADHIDMHLSETGGAGAVQLAAVLWRDRIHLVGRPATDVSTTPLLLDRAANRRFFKGQEIAATQISSRKRLEMLAGTDERMAVLSGVLPLPVLQTFLSENGKKERYTLLQAGGLEALENEFVVLDYIPGGTYDGIDQDVDVLSVPLVLLVRSEMDENTVYWIARTIMENGNFFEKIHPAGAEIIPDATMDLLPAFTALRMHIGASHYFEELGYPLPVN